MAINMISDSVSARTPPLPAPVSPAESVAKSANQAAPSEVPRYLSPVIRLDDQSGLALIQYRNGATGQTEAQIPAASVVREYQALKQQEFEKVNAVPAPAPSSTSTTAAVVTPNSGAAQSSGGANTNANTGGQGSARAGNTSQGASTYQGGGTAYTAATAAAAAPVVASAVTTTAAAPTQGADAGGGVGAASGGSFSSPVSLVA